MIQQQRKGIFFKQLRFILFVFIWISGLICGGCIANQASETYLLLMRRCVSAPVSITGLLVTMCLPLLFVFLAIYISRPGLIYPICFVKACSFSLTGFAVIDQFGSAGWLVQFLLQLAEMGALVLLCLYALRHLDGNREGLRFDTLFCVSGVLCLGCIDRYIVSQFLAALM